MIDLRLGQIWGTPCQVSSIVVVIMQVQPERVKLTQRLSQSRPLYEAFKQIKDGDSWHSLSEAQQRIIDGELRDFVLGGVALEVCLSKFQSP